MMSKVPMIPFYRQHKLSCLEGPYSWYTVKEKALIGARPDPFLGRWSSSSLLSALLWAATHFPAGYNSFTNTAPSLGVCGEVKMGRLHIHVC